MAEDTESQMTCPYLKNEENGTKIFWEMLSEHMRHSVLGKTIKGPDA